MTCASCDTSLAGHAGTQPSRTSRLARRIVAALTGIGQAVIAARQRRSERDIARFISGSGGRLTDDIERRMLQHLTSSNFSAHD